MSCQLTEVFVSCPHDDCLPEPNNGFRCIDDTGLDRDLVGLEPGFFERVGRNGHKMLSGDILYASSAGKFNGNARNEFVINPESTVSVEKGNRNGSGNGDENTFGNDNGNRNGNSLRGSYISIRRLVAGSFVTKLTGDASVLIVYVTAKNDADPENHISPTLPNTTFVNEVFGTDNCNLVRSIGITDPPRLLPSIAISLAPFISSFVLKSTGVSIQCLQQ
jgi:hypothetical protein